MHLKKLIDTLKKTEAKKILPPFQINVLNLLSLNQFSIIRETKFCTSA